MSEQKPKGVGDVKITQKDVDNFFNSIHTDALVDSIKMSYKPTFKVKIIEEVPNYAPTWEDIEKGNINHYYTLEEEVNEFIEDNWREYPHFDKWVINRYYFVIINSLQILP